MAKRAKRRQKSGSSLAILAHLLWRLMAFIVKVAALLIVTAARLLVRVGWLLYWLVAGRKRKRLHYQTLGAFLSLTPAEFEQAIGDLLHDLGYRNIRRTGGPHDLAADLCCFDGKGRRTVVQCKRYGPGNRVGSPEMQTFIGMVTVHHQAESGIFVTTSAFTEPARRLAEQHSIELIDGERLTNLASQQSHRPDQRWIA